MNHPTLLALLATLALAPFARAHDGPRVWVGSDAGTIVTLASDDDFDPTAYAPARVFEAELSPFFGTYTTQFPGYESPRDGSGGIADGVAIGFRIAGPLLTLDAAGGRLVPAAERFGAANAPRLSLTLPGVGAGQAAQYTRRNGAGVVDGFDFTDLISEHAHLAHTFLGDGAAAAAAGPDGAYVLPMVLTSPSLARSDWYFLSFAKGEVTPADRAAAAASARRMADALPGDANFDGGVGFADLVTLAQHYGAPADQWWATGDFDVDGAVGFSDLVILAQHYGDVANFSRDWARAQALVPEPGMAAIACAALATTSRRRGRPS